MEELKTDIFIFTEKGDSQKIKDCTFLRQFYFARNDFFLVDLGGRYNVCTPYNDELYAIWARERGNIMPGEAISLFRKEYLDCGITQKKIDSFLKKPKKFGKAFPYKIQKRRTT